MPRTAVLDKPKNQTKILAQIEQQRGIEIDVWTSVDISLRSYNRYKRSHPEFVEKIEKIQESFQVTRRPKDDEELRQMGQDLFKQYIMGGCRKRRFRRIMDAIPLKNPDGSHKVNKKGEKLYDYVTVQAIETVYENGIDLKAWEKIFPDEPYSERSLRFIVASQYQDISDHIESIDEQQVIIRWLKEFKDRFIMEMAAITGITPKKEK